MNTANKLTLLRVVMIPAFLLVLYLHVPGANYWALGIISLASITDTLAGNNAPHKNQITDFGKFMDPLADKCLVMAALCWFVETGDMMGWVLAAVLLREFAVFYRRTLEDSTERISLARELDQVQRMVCICLILFGIPHWLNLVCQGVILVTTVYSGVEYFVKNWDVFSEK